MVVKTIFKQIEKRVRITQEEKPSVILSLRDWEMIGDVIMELSSPKLLTSIEKARQDYKKGKGIAYNPL